MGYCSQIKRNWFPISLSAIVIATIFLSHCTWMWSPAKQPEHGTFACAVNCMDGRVQEPVANWLKREYKVDYVDMVTEPGPNKILAEDKDEVILKNIYKRVEISTGRHGAEVIAIVGHHDCAGNPVPETEQIEHLKRAKAVLQNSSILPFRRIVLLWVDRDWQVKEIE